MKEFNLNQPDNSDLYDGTSADDLQKIEDEFSDLLD